MSPTPSPISQAEQTSEADMDLGRGSELYGQLLKARKLANNRRFLRATRLYARVLRSHSPNIDSGIWREFNVLLGARNIGSRQKSLIWKSTEGFLDGKFEQIKQATLAGDSQRASSGLKTFSSGVFCKHCLPELIDAIEAISLGAHRNLPLLHQVLDSYQQSPRVVLVGGLNWSGSSAVFDYLREYDDAVAVETEIPHLSRGRFNLGQIWKARKHADRLRLSSIEFLFRYLLGFSKVREAMDYRIHKFARRNLLSRPCDYSRSVIECAVVICALSSQSATANTDILIRTLASIVLRKIVTSELIEDNQVLVLNNAVKAVNLAQALPLTHATAFSVFRDPRDSYVAQIQEKHNLGIPVDTWVDGALRRYGISQRTVAEAELDSDEKRIIKVQFEEFVTSETERFRVRELAGLKTSSWSHESKFFNAESSLPNVGLFRTYGDKSSISKIESLMPNYLWNE